MRRWSGPVLALALALTPTTAGARPRATSTGTLAGVTRITWTGMKGLRLTVPRDASIPPYAGLLTVRGGTYAFVRWYQTRACPAELGEHCNVEGISYTADFWRGADLPGRDHDVAIASPNAFRRGVYEMYLFTDGTATFEIEAKGLTGHADYLAAGRVSGRVERLDGRCPTAACDPANGYAGRVRFGGGARDVGRGGYAEALVWNVNTDDYAVNGVVPWTQPHVTGICVYPGWRGANTLSPDPADHPTGCDAAGTDPTNALYAATHTWDALATGAVGTGGTFANEWNSEVTGKAYVGFQVANAYDLSKPSAGAYGLWFTYGIG
jgi:hypothetical protein